MRSLRANKNRNWVKEKTRCVIPVGKISRTSEKLKSESSLRKISRKKGRYLKASKTLGLKERTKRSSGPKSKGLKKNK